MASEIKVLEDTTAATGVGVAAMGEADAAEESLKDDVYTGAAYGDLEKLHRLVEREGRAVKEPDGLGYHALQWAALNNRVAAAQYIVEYESGNPILDFFFQVVPNTPPGRVHELLATAWAHDPLTTLKLVCNLCGVRGTGKSDKEGFYAAALWMHAEHPKTLAYNVAAAMLCVCTPTKLSRATALFSLQFAS
ncbi:hypothetical protein QYE76_068822 [Lolium multiflorum]|uniref:DUF2828 domain-containing protein n=1 Tax=Lolium multiflorum TaxID=4521 RepID=A0AAD8WEB5_LOLMU|nr:hypothetical protein QYE76_068822 [Lolium multiflorum]